MRPRSNRPSSLTLALALAALTSFQAGCAEPKGSAAATGTATPPAAAAATPASDDTLRIVVYGWPASLNPHLSVNTDDSWIFHQVFEGLVDVDAGGNYVGRLAKSWAFEADGKDLHFELREDVTWHDGQPFTSADVVWSYQSLRDHADASLQALVADVTSVEAKGDHAVVVHYREPFAPALSAWRVPILPAHLFPKDRKYEEASAAFRGIGTGPYAVAAVSERDSIELARNPAFSRPVPFFARVVFKLMTDTTSTLEVVREGNLDVTRMRPADWRFNTPDDRWGTVIDKVKNPGLGYSYIGWNQDGSNPFFTDRRVRRALSMMWNPTEGNAMYLADLGEIAFGPYPQSSRYFNPNFTPPVIDTNAASRELDQAGWSDHDGDGVRDRDGVPFRFKLLTLDSFPFTNEVAFALAQKLDTIGVKMEYVRVTFPDLLDRLQRGKFDAYILQWSGDMDPDLFPLFHSSQHEGGLNYVAYVNPEVDELLERGRRTLDPDKRVEIYRRLHEVIYQDQPYLFLYFAPTLWGVSTRLDGVEPHPAGLLTGWPGILAWRSTRPAAAIELAPEKPPVPNVGADGFLNE